MVTTTEDRPDHLYLSNREQGELTNLLISVEWVVEELDTTLTRQAQFSNPYEEGKASETVLVFHEGASDAALDLYGTLSAWVNTVCTQRQLVFPGVMRSDLLGRWLRRHVSDVALLEDAEEALDEIRDAVKRCVRVVDRPLGRIYVGPCGNESDAGRCGADLYASPLKPTVVCRDCGALHEVEKRRDQIRDQVRELLGTAAEIARTLPWILDAPVTRKRITYYARKGMISPRTSSFGTVYKIGEVIDAHIAFEAARAA